MFEREENNSGEESNNELDLSKLKQEVNSSIEQHSDNKEIVRELEQIKKTLDDSSLSEEEKRNEIKEELKTLKENEVILSSLTELEGKINALDSSDISVESWNNVLRASLQEIAAIPDQEERDKSLSRLADAARGVSEENVISIVEEMKEVRPKIGRFFGNKI